MLAEANSNAAAVVKACPTCTAGNIHSKVQDRPIAHGVGAVLHCLGLAVWACHAAAIKMVPANHNRCLHFAACNQLVELQAGQVAFAKSKPADPCWQALERDALLRHADPAMQARIVRE